MAPDRRDRARRNAARDPSDDSWVDRVADTVQDLLAEEGLEMEMCVWYDPVTEQLHAVGFDGAPARYFRCAASEQPSPSPRSEPDPRSVAAPLTAMSGVGEEAVSTSSPGMTVSSRSLPMGLLPLPQGSKLGSSSSEEEETERGVERGS